MLSGFTFIQPPNPDLKLFCNLHPNTKVFWEQLHSYKRLKCYHKCTLAQSLSLPQTSVGGLTTLHSWGETGGGLNPHDSDNLANYMGTGTKRSFLHGPVLPNLVACERGWGGGWGLGGRWPAGLGPTR